MFSINFSHHFLGNGNGKVNSKFTIKDLESEELRLQIAEEFKIELYHCFGIE